MLTGLALALGGHVSAGEGSPPVGPAQGWRLYASLGTTSVSANNVLGLPLALGAGLLVERTRLGVEGTAHADAATICDQIASGGGGDGYCGLLWIFALAPRFTPFPDAAFSPFASLALQLFHMDLHGWVPAAGPRLGLRIRGDILGGYIDGGASLAPARDARFGGFTLAQSRWIPQVSMGVTIRLR